MTAPLPRSRPADQAVSARSLLALLDALEASPHEMHSLMVLRHGQVVAEGWWAPYGPDRPHLLYSLSKAFTALAVGLAVDEGLIGLDDPLVSHLGRFAPADLDPRVEAVTIRHALTMTTGHDADPIFAMFLWTIEHPDDDWLDGFLAMPPEQPPGEVFTYNQLATYCLSRIIQERSGQRLVDYLRPRLFDPLGIDAALWLGDGKHDWGFSGLHVTTEAIAKLGQLCLQGGRWGNRQVVPAAWMADATTQQVANDLAHRGSGDRNAEPDWTSGYGYQFWMCRHGYRGDGAFGQFCIVWPDEDVAIATTASTMDMQALLDLIEQHLTPGLDRADDPAERAAEAAADGELTARLAALALPTPVDRDGTAVAGTYEREADEPARRLRRIQVAEAEVGWTVTVELTTDKADLAVVPGRWTTTVWPSEPTVPVAVAGGRGADGALHLDLAFVQTPHHLLLRLDPSTGTFAGRWNDFPLHGQDPGDFAIA